MIELPTPETKWYVTEYPEECSFAITDGNEILVTIIGGNTIGDQCDLASRIAKLPDLERERDEAIDKYQSLQKTFEEWQLKFLSEQAKLLHNKDVERDKLFDEAYQIRIERDELLDILRKLLEIIPEPECHDFGHTKEERHAFLEECPVMARYDALITKAREAAK